MLIIDSLLQVGSKLIDKLIPDPEAKAKAQMDLAKMAQDGELQVKVRLLEEREKLGKK